MKKELLFITVILFLLSCSSDDEVASLKENVNSTESVIRSYSEALDIAQKAITMVSNVETRSQERIAIDLTASKKCIMANRTRGAESSVNDTLMYVFNFANDNGFAIISANPNIEPILAVAESGHYDPDSLSDIDGVNDFIELAKEYTILPDTAFIPKETVLNGKKLEFADTVITRLYGDKVFVAWGQKDPEGLFCPNKIAGCANTALAQIMSYFKYPTEIRLTYPANKGKLISLDWKDITKHKIHHSYLAKDCPASDKAHDDISMLVRELGYRDNSDYSSSTGTSTPTYIMPSVIENLGYSVVGYDSFSMNDVIKYLNDGYKIFMVGFADEGGHAWVVDQYADVTITIRNDLSPQIAFWSGHFIHINWGWNGSCDGYFNGKVFDTSKTYSPDYNGIANHKSYNFTTGLQTLKIKKI